MGACIAVVVHFDTEAAVEAPEIMHLLRCLFILLGHVFMLDYRQHISQAWKTPSQMPSLEIICLPVAPGNKLLRWHFNWNTAVLLIILITLLA